MALDRELLRRAGGADLRLECTDVLGAPAGCDELRALRRCTRLRLAHHDLRACLRVVERREHACGIDLIAALHVERDDPAGDLEREHALVELEHTLVAGRCLLTITARDGQDDDECTILYHPS
jgi:hypothetical protein